MTFFELFGGIILFGILWAFMPRVSFLAILSLYLYDQYGFFHPVNNSIASATEGFAFFFLLIGVTVGFFFDLLTIKKVLR